MIVESLCVGTSNKDGDIKVLTLCHMISEREFLDGHKSAAEKAHLTVNPHVFPIIIMDLALPAHLYECQANNSKLFAIAHDCSSAQKMMLAYLRENDYLIYFCKVKNAINTNLLHHYAVQILLGPDVEHSRILECTVRQDIHASVLSIVKARYREDMSLQNLTLEYWIHDQRPTYLFVRSMRIHSLIGLVWRLSTCPKELCTLFDRLPYRQENYCVQHTIDCTYNFSIWVNNDGSRIRRVRFDID